MSFQRKSLEEEENCHSEAPEHVSAEKEKEENPEGDQVEGHHPSVPHVEKAEMEAEEGEEHQEVMVEPILVSLFQSPSKSELLELS